MKKLLCCWVSYMRNYGEEYEIHELRPVTIYRSVWPAPHITCE